MGKVGRWIDEHRDEFNEVSEAAFYMIGGVDEAKEANRSHG